MKHTYRRQFGFTFIEMSVATIVIALMSLTVMVLISTGRAGETLRAFKADLRRVAMSCRERAISSRQETTIAIAENGRSLELRQGGDDGNQSTIETIPFPEGVTDREFQLNGNVVSSTEFQIRFFPDGTCDSGGIAFWDNGTAQFAVAYDSKSGSATVTDGDIPNLTEDKWQAGELEIRGGGNP